MSESTELSLMEKAGEIVWVPIESIKLNPENMNTHPPEQVTALAELIQYQGWRHPIIISNQSGMCVVGEGRYLAAKQLGLRRVPVHFQDFESYDQEYAFLVSDNAIGSWSELRLDKIHLKLPDLHLPKIELLGIQNFRFEPPEFNTKKEWNGMPEFDQQDKTGFCSFKIHVRDHASMVRLSELLNQNITPKTLYLWFPEIVTEPVRDKTYEQS